MKKILSMLLVLILALSMAAFAFAEEESDADYILGNGVLNIGITLFAPCLLYTSLRRPRAAVAHPSL